VPRLARAKAATCCWGVVYGTGRFSGPMHMNGIIWRKAEEPGFTFDMITAEFDSPRFEYTRTFNDALKAVDDIVLFRPMARPTLRSRQTSTVYPYAPRPRAPAKPWGARVHPRSKENRPWVGAPNVEKAHGGRPFRALTDPIALSGSRRCAGRPQSFPHSHVDEC